MPIKEIYNKKNTIYSQIIKINNNLNNNFKKYSIRINNKVNDLYIEMKKVMMIK